jgi:hypothetical protein
MTPTMEAAVLICPVTPTASPKEFPMSMRRRPVRNPGGIVAKREITSDGRSIRPGLPAVSFSASPIQFTDSSPSCSVC